MGMAMYPTKLFKNGNSQAVRIPADIAYERTDIELEIERVGEELRIRPVRRSLANVLDKFAKLGRDGGLAIERDLSQTERDPL
jgi:antitoxin VapB